MLIENGQPIAHDEPRSSTWRRGWNETIELINSLTVSLTSHTCSVLGYSQPYKPRGLALSHTCLVTVSSANLDITSIYLHSSTLPAPLLEDDRTTHDISHLHRPCLQTHTPRVNCPLLTYDGRSARHRQTPKAQKRLRGAPGLAEPRSWN